MPHTTGDGAADYPVLIAGGGPSGMLLAALLSRCGVRVALVERYPSRRQLPKAHVVNPVTLEICRQAGVDMAQLHRLAADPADDRLARFCDRLVGRDIGALPFERQAPGWVAHPRINVAQPLFERVVEEHLRAHCDVDWIVGSWQDADLDADGCRSRIRDADGGLMEITSRFVVGADGANSAVRACAGIEMLGEQAERTVISVHLRADLRRWVRGREAAMYWTLDPAASGGFIAHDIDSQWVFVYHPADGLTPDVETATAHVRAAIGSPDVPFEVVAVSPWLRASMVAEQMRAGQVFLLGDAAHRLPPSGGLGLNTGVQDAANLAWKLAAVIHGWADDAILDTYDAERRPIAQANTYQSLANAHLMQRLRTVIGAAIGDGTLGSLSDYEIAEIVDEQWVGLNSPGLQLGYTYGRPWPIERSPARHQPDAQIGNRVPHASVRVDGGWRAVHDLFDYRSFVLLTADAAPDWAKVGSATSAPVVVRSLGADEVDDGDEHGAGWLALMELTPGAGVLVTPDGHIAQRVAAGPDAATLIAAAIAAYTERGQLFADQQAAALAR